MSRRCSRGESQWLPLLRMAASVIVNRVPFITSNLTRSKSTAAGWIGEARPAVVRNYSVLVRFAVAIVAMSCRTSREIGGRPGACDFQRQNSWNPFRRQRISVSGFTMTRDRELGA
jgi:hypothetical protein